VKNPLTLAAGAKGRLALTKRIGAISRRYGLTTTKMDQALGQFARVLQQFDCSASFPITAVALKRNSRAIRTYQEQGIEFAVHGYVHVDHTQLSFAEQATHLSQAREVFDASGIRIHGFRCPYLRWDQNTLQALHQQGFSYDSSQALAWDIMDGHTTAGYQRVLDFYGARSAADYPALPRLEDGLIRIPYCIPDDEAIVDRLALPSFDKEGTLWKAILQQTYALGELFTLGLHPERITLCQPALSATLAAARALTPTVWIARLDEIATWWRQRRETKVALAKAGAGRWQVTVDGPRGVTILARDVHVSAPTLPWADDYQQVNARSFTVQADRRPVIGVAPASSTRLTSFLRQQGYLVEVANGDRLYSINLDQTDLAERDERKMLARLDQERGPLLRLGRWPDGARSALSVTGDIDALTLWDYGLRFLGR
jgi:peptidoglycan/xylan/chitin deacetylase (PgdA/CDA1 family)